MEKQDGIGLNLVRMAVRGQGVVKGHRSSHHDVIQDLERGDQRSPIVLQDFGIHRGDDGGLPAVVGEVCSVCDPLGVESFSGLGGERGEDEVEA